MIMQHHTSARLLMHMLAQSVNRDGHTHGSQEIIQAPPVGSLGLGKKRSRFFDGLNRLARGRSARASLCVLRSCSGTGLTAACLCCFAGGKSSAPASTKLLTWAGTRGSVVLRFTGRCSFTALGNTISNDFVGAACRPVALSYDAALFACTVCRRSASTTVSEPVACTGAVPAQQLS